MYYILFRHRNDRKSSVSLHAAIDSQSHAAFAIGHFIGGMAFLYFAYKYFYVDKASLYLLIVSCFGVFAEQVQAFLPNKRGLEKIHTIAAAFMATFISLIVISAPFIIELGTAWLAVYAGLVVLLCMSGVYALLNKNEFYKTQMLFFSAFYIFLLILLYGTVN
jgi:hypothetical protein